MHLTQFRVTRFQFARDRVTGDSQVRADAVNVAAVELIDDRGRCGLGFAQSLFRPLPDIDEITRIFLEEAWPTLRGEAPLGSGGNQRPYRAMQKNRTLMAGISALKGRYADQIPLCTAGIAVGAPKG